MTPVAATVRHRDGRERRLGADAAEALYVATHATRDGLRLRSLWGRSAFERGVQLRILRWLEDHEREGRPRVLLIGDSIRMRQADATGYGLHAYRELVEEFNLTHIPYNTGNSQYVLDRIDDMLSCRPDIVHFNAGLHDVSRIPGTNAPAKTFHTPEAYQGILDAIVRRMRDAGVPRILWASSTPVHDAWHRRGSESRRERGIVRSDADVVRYNAIAAEVMDAHGVPVDDLHAHVREAGLERCLLADGVHLCADGARLLGVQVARFVRGRPGS